MKPVRSTIAIGIALLVGAIGYPQASQSPPQSPAQSAAPLLTDVPAHRAVLTRYCVTCHNEKLKTAGLSLDRVDVGNVGPNAEVWEKVIRKLQAASMPPRGLPRPDQATYHTLATYLETALDRAGAANPNPGRPALRRLNRTEYANVIRDLLGVDIDAESLLPADDSGYGFDNIGDVLTVSPTLMERYMSAAARISRLAVGDKTVKPISQTYEVPQFLMQNIRMSDDLPFGTRGGTSIRYHFPVDGEYSITIGLQRNKDGYILGVADAHQLEILVDGERVKTFTVGGEVKGRWGHYYDRGDEAQEAYERGGAEEGLTARFKAKAGPRAIGITFLDDTIVPEGVFRTREAGFHVMYNSTTDRATSGNPAVSGVIIDGPYNTAGLGDTPSRRRIFVCQPAGTDTGDACARRILSTVARRAYRRPVTAREIETLVGFYRTGNREGGFEAGIELALNRILVSPKFLFRSEPDPVNAAPGTVYRISDLELASRLSFFVWSSIPDDQLLDAAVAGRLKNPAALEQQVHRMLRDARSKALVSNFAGQWLLLRNIRSVAPDQEVFQDFDENLRDAFQRETELFFESIMRENRSVLDLLDADYTFLNERLARHYGIPNVFGNHFRRVSLNGQERRGLLGQGSILTVSSYPNRTSPTLRGKWVMENILGTPPPPPPANVPSLKEAHEDGKVLTMRQRLEQHRTNPVCASCHNQMDPLGFALENFDGIGQWRTSEVNVPVDSSGVLPDGTAFRGPSELRTVLRRRPEEFVATLNERLLTYALGRSVEYFDLPVVRAIMRDAAPGGYRWSSLVLGIVKSTPFQMRRTLAP
ncbi:MAG: DUF1592 domain-containing protein [Acidobacteria bacterium]|nr:DUF1592 domain-containing protein [Acidobacteriota bacterium]